MKSIPGRPLPGFFGLFDADFGDPSTESPMRTITPSFVGESMLPFRCPRCRKVPQELACPVTREHYRDTREGRKNHFCPSCGCRFRIDERGVILPCPVPAGATVGPSRVEYGGVTSWQDNPNEGGSLLSPVTIFGTLLGESGADGYAILGRREATRSEVFGAGLANFWRTLLSPRPKTPRPNQLLAPRGPDEVFYSPTRTVVSPLKGASTVFVSPKSVSVTGGVRSVPPRSWSADTVNFDGPKVVVVVPQNGPPQTFQKAGYLQVYGGKSSRS